MIYLPARTANMSCFNILIAYLSNDLSIFVLLFLEFTENADENIQCVCPEKIKDLSNR